jgi:glycosyltransferase involved in cell wall biosynthesis
LHITYYSPAWPPVGVANGIVTYVSIIRDYLLRQGHQVSVLSDGTLHLADGRAMVLDAPQPRGAFWPKMISRIDRRLGHHPFVARDMARQLRRARSLMPIDLIEMEETFGWSGLIADRIDVPVVMRLHGPQFLKSPGDFVTVSRRHGAQRERAEGRAIRKSKALLAPTAALLAATRARYGSARGRASVIPNPIAAVPAGDVWRLDDCERDTLLCVGRLDIAKGADTLLAAFERVLKQHPNARMTMVGPEGQIRRPDGSVIGFLDHVADTIPRDVLKRIKFAGLLDPTSIRALRKRAFLTVLASPNEIFSYAALEAMVAGCPLVVTDWPGASEIVDHGINGWLTPVGNVPAMAARIGWVLDNPRVAAEVGARAWEQCHTTFSVDTVGAAMVDFYQKILTDRRPS